MNPILPWAGVAVLFGLNKLWPGGFTFLFLLNIWLLSLPHTFSTFARKDRRTLTALILTSAVYSAFFLGVTAFAVWKGTVVLYSVYFFWQQFHYAKQNYGIASERGWMDQTFYLGTAMIAVLGIFSEGPQNFFGFVLAAPFGLQLSKIEIIALNSIFLCHYLLIRPMAVKAAIGHVAIFTFSYGLTDNFAEGWLYLNVFHNLQYLKYMQVFEKRWNYLALPALLTGIFYVLQNYSTSSIIVTVPLSIALMLALNFTHYSFDAYIWKSKVK